MRNKAKLLLLGSLAALLVVPLLGCGLVETFISPSALTSQQAIVIIQVAGIPYIDDYYKETIGGEDSQAPVTISPATPVGQWAANYEGEGNWRIQGPVATSAWGNCLTTWTLREEDSKIRLIGFNCD